MRANAIFSNPFLRDRYGNEEQRIFKMFWCPEQRDSVQKTFVLDKPMRTKDLWLQAVLDADRYGRETWEMYCFAHGLPTRNPGTWMPQTDAVACGQERCKTLASGAWSEMWRAGGMTRFTRRKKEALCACLVFVRYLKLDYCVFGLCNYQPRSILLVPNFFTSCNGRLGQWLATVLEFAGISVYSFDYHKL